MWRVGLNRRARKACKMTNQEKFIELMNEVFEAGFTKENMVKICSPCGALKKREFACDAFSCEGCMKWWDKEYHKG